MSDIVEEQSDDQSGVTSGVEKASYGSYFAGQNIFYALIFMFLVTFLTDVGIPAKIVAVIVLVVKVWDAVNDPIFGGLIDKIRFRKGRFVPWLRISLVGVPIVTILLFAIPSGLSLGSKIVWSVIAYVLWDTAYTICDVPIFGLVTTMTADLGDRTKLISLGRLAANIAMAAVIMALPLFRQAVGGWLPMVVILSVAGGLLMIPICFTAKERVIPHQEAESVGLRQLGRFLIGNKYLLIFYAAMIISQSFAVLNALNMYVVRYNLGDERWLTLVAAISLVPIVVAALLMPSIVKRVDKFTLYFWSSVGSVIIALVAYFVGYHNFTALMVLLAIRSVIAAVPAILLFAFTPDCLEYGMYKKGIPAAGMSFAVQTFTAKFTAAISGALGAFLLGLVGFVSGEGAAQPAGFDDRLWLIYTVVPAIGTLISLPVLWMYKLRDKDVQVMADYNSGVITRDEAETELGGRY